VVRSDDTGAAELAAQSAEAVVLSPGPGRPETGGCCLEMVVAVDEATPVLGVCLGHQAIGAAFGGPVVRAPEPVHGKASLVYHEGRGIFSGLPSPFEAGRYHSLVVDPGGLPPQPLGAAQAEGGLGLGGADQSPPPL